MFKLTTVNGRPTLALCSVLVPKTLSCSVYMEDALVHYLRNIEIRIKTKIKQT